jgi:arylsulfatase A-like enzyme
MGKWHLGLKDECRPNANGFDEFSGFLAGCIDYYSHIFYWGMADGNTNPTHDLWENDEEVYENGEYMTERITRKSVEFIQKHHKEPFMLYVAYNAPHYPMHAPDKYIRRFPYLSKDKQIMAAMISAVDDGVGEIRNELIRQGLFDNTIIYFQSDNGPSRESRNWLDGTQDYYYGGSAGIFSGHKFSLFEGGIRIPAILSWNGKINSFVEDAPHISTDIFPTLLELCGGNPNEYELDGMSLVPMLDGIGKAEHEYIFWEMEGQTAVRKGKYKLVLNGQLVEGEEKRADVFLSDLDTDPGEKNNLADEMPELCSELKEKAIEWRNGIETTWDEKFAMNYSSLT